MLQKILIALVLSGALSWASTVSAAEIKVAGTPGCAISLNGEITPGDPDKIRQLAAKLHLDRPFEESGEPTNAASSALCLNSPGGSYLAGQRIAEFLFEHGIATRLLADAECYSACANIFMAGRLAGAEADGPSRSMHYSAKLGFHAPYLKHTADETLTGEQANDEIIAQNRILSDFIRFGSHQTAYSHVPLIQPSLISQLLAAGPADLVLVDSLDKAARWSIDIEGLPETWNVGRISRIFACVNFQAWATDQSAADNQDIAFYVEQPMRTKTIKTYAGATDYEVIETGGESERNCLVSITNDETNGFEICSRDDFTGRNFGVCEDGQSIWLPWYYGLPAKTTLMQIAAAVQSAQAAAPSAPPPKRRPVLP